MKLLVYIPALNEERDISKAIEAIPKNIKGVDNVDVLVVDDGSEDQTVRIAKESGAYVVSHEVNKGVGRAFRTGLQFAREKKYDILVSIDADMQFDAKEIPQLIEPILRNKADMVVGNRFHSGIPENMSKSKYWGNMVMAKIISSLTSKELVDVASGFRAYNKESIHNLNLFGNFTYTQESILDIAYKGLRIVEIPVSIKYFKNRVSRVAKSIFKYAFKTLWIILSFLIIYRPQLILFSLLALLTIINILIYILLSFDLFIIVLVSSLLIYFTTFLFVLFKNVRRIIDNQGKILTKLESIRYEE